MTAKKGNKKWTIKKAPISKPAFDEALQFAEEELAHTQEIVPSRKADNGSLERVVGSSVSAGFLMPQTEEENNILCQRADLLATMEEEKVDEGQREPYIRVRLGPSEKYGIPYHYLDEIMYVANITSVPGTPEFIAGVINRTGQLLTVLDLKPFFRTQVVESTPEARIIVVRAAEMKVGLLVDAVEDSDVYEPDQLAPPLSSNGVSSLDYVKGIYGGTITMLDIEALLSDPELMVNERENALYKQFPKAGSGDLAKGEFNE